MANFRRCIGGKLWVPDFYRRRTSARMASQHGLGMSEHCIFLLHSSIFSFLLERLLLEFICGALFPGGVSPLLRQIHDLDFTGDLCSYPNCVGCLFFVLSMILDS